MSTIHQIAAASLVLLAASAGAESLHKDAEASLLVTGTIDVSADGNVLHYAIDHPEKIDAGVTGLIDRSLAGWHFKPMKAPVSATMRLVLHMRQDTDGDYKAWVDSTNFETQDENQGWSFRKLKPPEYPYAALRDGVTGTAYLYVRADHDGKVVDVIASQVDLGMRGTSTDMARWRNLLAETAIDAAKKWQLNPPTATAAMDNSAAGMTVMVPVVYSMTTQKPVYGKWEGYYPGPHQQAPWLPGPESVAMKNPEALVANGIYPVGSHGLELLTSLAAAQ